MDDVSWILFDATETVLHLNLTNNTRQILRSGVVDRHISDHSLVILSCESRYHDFDRKKYRYFCSFKHFDRDKFVGDLSAVPFHILEIFSDGDDMYVFEALYNDILDEHLPLHFNSNLKDISGPPGPFNYD